MANEMSADAEAYYAGGFKRIIGGVPCKVFARRTTDGRWINAKDSAHYDPLYDDPSHGISRLERDHDTLEQAQLALNERQARKPRKPYTRKAASVAPVEAHEAISAPMEPETPQIAPVAVSAPVPAHSGDILARLARLEALAGIVDAPKRTAAHAAAIRRAWAMRAAMRQRADLDRRALLAVNAANADLREQVATVEAARAAAVHRAQCDERRAIDAETAIRFATDERDAALSLASEMETRAAGADRAATAMRRDLIAIEARADRLARIAVSHRRDVRHARDDVRRAQLDVVLVRRSERQAVKRLDDLRAAVASSPTVQKIVERIAPQAVAA